jgi:hypothetical protein
MPAIFFSVDPVNFPHRDHVTMQFSDKTFGCKRISAPRWNFPAGKNNPARVA